MFDETFMFNLVIVLLAACASVFFFTKRAKRYLQFLQQEDYDHHRFKKWFFARKAFDTRGSLVCIVGIAASYLSHNFAPTFTPYITIALAALLFYVATREENPMTHAKVSLKMTQRAKRIYNLALCTYTASLALVMVFSFKHFYEYVFTAFWIKNLVLIQFISWYLIKSNWLLDPYEKNLQEKFANEARAIVKDVDPVVIGITGSYGKTSTKVILAEILGAVAPTFSTPRSINSYMGMTREIRERMKPGQKFAVVEMGAYHVGSIKRMCSLTPPHAAIVTAVGEMHLELFGSPENVFKAKSELPQAVPEEGVLVVNGDNVWTRKMAELYPKKTTLIYGLNQDAGPLDVYMYDIEPTAKGTNFAIRIKGREFQGFTKLLGEPMLSNILASFTMACAMGLAPELVLAAIRNVKTESNRLEPVRTTISSFIGTPNGRPIRQGDILRLNDAFNSNPVGFKAALDVLGSQKGNRKILVTPGMIELGPKQFEENKKAAQHAATLCDQAIIVGATNKDALVSGLKEGGLATEKIREVATMREAFSYLAYDYCDDGDIVLIENDLPDLYESNPRF